MRKFTVYLISLCLVLCLLSGCSNEQPQIVATTLPVYEFTCVISAGTGLHVEQLITENVSCLHDYTLQVSQMKMVEAAELIFISGAGLEDFIDDVLASGSQIVDCSQNCSLRDTVAHNHEDTHAHHHETDPHIWLSPENAKIMAANICNGLTEVYPQYTDIFADNLADLTADLDTLQAYGSKTLQSLSSRELITFHDGFSYFADSFSLTILEAVEEESGSEASAQELKRLITLIDSHHLPAVFTEKNGSVSAANIICAETGAQTFTLDMAMAGESYMDAMYQNINTIKEALG